MASITKLKTSTLQSPPEAIEAEESLLGAMLLSQSATERAIELLSPGDFYSPANQIIFSACCHLARESLCVDSVMVANYLANEGLLESVGGVAKLSFLTSTTPAIGHIDGYGHIVLEASLKRRLMALGQEISRLATQPNQKASDAIAQSEGAMWELSSSRLGASNLKNSSDIAQISRDTTTFAQSHLGHYFGPPTGLRGLDEALRGLRAGLIIIGARPNMGKTTLALQIALSAAKASYPSVIYSLEMSCEVLAQRLVTILSGVPSYVIESRQLTESEQRSITKAQDLLASLPLFIDDSAELDISTLRSRLRRQVRTGVRLAVVDYLQQLALPSARSREVEINTLAQACKRMAHENNIPLIVPSQLSRSLEMRQDKRPMLSDLRESGGIENEADLVLFPFREGYYSEDLEDQDRASIHCAKQRVGGAEALGKRFSIRWDSSRGVFADRVGE